MGTTHSFRGRFVLLLLVLTALVACARESSGSLPQLKIDPARVSVAGLSAGAYMATQSHLAWPEIFSGAALVAGGPYGCAEGQLAQALSSCMKGEPPIKLEALADTASQRSADGLLGPLADLAGDRVYVLHGREDATVAESVSRDAAAFYQALQSGNPELASMEITWDGERAFAHNLPVADTGDDCHESKAPFLGRCGFDAAGEILRRLYGEAPAAAGEATGELRSFDQKALNGEPGDAQLADTGYVYLPSACLAGESCGVLVVFHGCEQNADAVGEAFVRDAGFNRWADAYHLAVLYPQARASYVPLNPKACWDWWGYSGADYDTRQGVQQQWLRHALTALGVPFVQA